MPEGNDKDAKRQKQQRKMTKVLSKAWGLDKSADFQVAKGADTGASASPLDLQTIGQRLDAEQYPFGRSGWETFATDLGGVYRRHIIGGSKKVATLAKAQLSEAVSLLAKIDPKLGEIAQNAKPPPTPNATPSKSKKDAHHPKENGKTKGTSSSRRNQNSASNSATKSSKSTGNGRGSQPRNAREIETETKRIKKELEKYLKSHKKAVKALEDFKNDREDSRYPMDDDFLFDEPGDNQPPSDAIVKLNPDITEFPGFPAFCIPDVLMSWDFICTFHKSLSLETISLDSFVAALTYRSPGNTGGLPLENNSDHDVPPDTVPVFLGEVHMALLNLLMQDRSSDSWWWCTLFSEAEAASGDAVGTNDGKGKRSGDEISPADDGPAPVIKINMLKLLSHPEDPELTARWVQTLDSVRMVRANLGTPFKIAIKNALAFTTNDYVKSYLKKAMKPWKANSAAFTKRAVIWLVDKVREGRPDLLGKKINEAALKEQIAKVSTDAARAMTAMPEDVLNMQVADEDGSEGGSDDEGLLEDEETEEDVFSQVADLTNEDDDVERLAKRRKVDGGIEEEAVSLVTSSVPAALSPTYADLLLPPSKPLPGSNVISPFTWPALVGAVCRRVLHFFKQKRNEADDELRRKNNLPSMTKKERERREKICAQRVFSECFANEGGSDCPLEMALDCLNKGGCYLSLSPQQRLCLIRVMIEAAYESEHVRKCVSDNFRDRTSATKSLDLEQKRARKEAREEAMRADRAARERLSAEATQDDDGNTVLPESWSKTEVTNMVAKMQEEEAFGAKSVSVLTLEDIILRDKEELDMMKEELGKLGGADNLYEGRVDRETSAKIDRLNREISNLECDHVTLPEIRARACHELNEAIEEGTVKALRGAIKNAKLAGLMGQCDDEGSIWSLDVLRDAAIELKAAEKRRRLLEAQRDLIAKRDRCFVRSEPLGTDRHHNKYWHFVYDCPGRIWAEQDLSIVGEKAKGLGPIDEEDDFLPQTFDSSIASKEDFISFIRQEYHPSGSLPSLAHFRWGDFSSDKSLRALAKCLDERGIRESALKNDLKEALEARLAVTEKAEHETPDKLDEGTALNEGSTKVNKLLNAGDEEAFQGAVISFKDSHELNSTATFLDDLKSAMQQKVRIRQKAFGSAQVASTAPIVSYETGTVVGWRGSDHEIKESEWQISLDKGGELFLDSNLVVESMRRYKLWIEQSEEYFEEDAPFLSYRNKLGRFYGKASEAVAAATAKSLSRVMLKREQDLYSALKSRTYDNSWGGKSGARLAWIASLREYGHLIDAVRDSLITIEEAFYELVNGESAPTLTDEDWDHARQSLHSSESRFEIELESLGGIKGLWNSQESRNIFLVLMKETTSVSMVALGLDLLCRNTKAYLDAMGMSSRTSTLASTTRSSNGVAEYGVTSTRSGRQSARSVRYDEFF